MLAQGADAPATHAALAAHLSHALEQLEPQCLGLYWPIRSEFDVLRACVGEGGRAPWPLALPFVQREPPAMHYRRWDARPPTARDEVGIPAPDGEPVVPDVVLVPCVGHTADGYRLGYGGGYFDRWIAAHPHATTIGISRAGALLAAAEFTPQPHDLPLTLVLTEHGTA